MRARPSRPRRMATSRRCTSRCRRSRTRRPPPPPPEAAEAAGAAPQRRPRCSRRRPTTTIRTSRQSTWRCRHSRSGDRSSGCRPSFRRSTTSRHRHRRRRPLRRPPTLGCPWPKRRRAMRTRRWFTCLSSAPPPRVLGLATCAARARPRPSRARPSWRFNLRAATSHPPRRPPPRPLRRPRAALSSGPCRAAASLICPPR